MEQEDRPREIFFTNRSNEDPFPNLSLLDPIDDDQEDDVRTAVEEMLDKDSESGLPEEYKKELEDTVRKDYGLCDTSFSARPPADIPPLQAVCVRIKMG